MAYHLMYTNNVLRMYATSLSTTLNNRNPITPYTPISANDGFIATNQEEAQLLVSLHVTVAIPSSEIYEGQIKGIPSHKLKSYHDLTHHQASSTNIYLPPAPKSDLGKQQNNAKMTNVLKSV